MRVLLCVVAVLAPVGLGACGGDDDAAPTGPETTEPNTVVVFAEDISFPEDVYEADAGTVNFHYENVGRIPHTLVIEDPDDDDEDLPGFDLQVNTNGDVDDGSIDLAPGTYTLYCDVAGHRAAGMVADLEIR